MPNVQNNKLPKIGVVGVGMVGRQILRYFSELGFKRGKNLFCYDSEPSKNFTDDVKKAEIIFVSVPTPRAKDGSCDTSIVQSVIKKYNSPGKIFVIKSTVEPGTAARLQKKTKAAILFNPEFLTESRAWEDFVRPDRQIVGYTSKSLPYASEILNLLPPAYFSSPGALNTLEFIRASATEAELAKYASNVFGAMKVSYANIIADFAMALEKVLKREGVRLPVRYEAVRKMIAHDRRIGDSWMDAFYGGYRGFAGRCYPKDLDAFIRLGEKLARKNKKERKLLKAGVSFLRSIRSYNQALFKFQGR